MLLSWCALVILFALIENVRPSSQATFNWWKLTMESLR
jgi:hypothetical protein